MPAHAAPYDYDAALRACARGEQQALHGLYQQESRYLLGVALRIVRQRALAEDVLHDAFLNIWRRAGSFDATRGSGKGWIYVVVRHQALDVARARAHELSADEDTVETLLHATPRPRYGRGLCRPGEHGQAARLPRPPGRSQAQ